MAAAPARGNAEAAAPPLDRRGTRVMPNDLQLGKTYILSYYGRRDYRLRIMAFGPPFPEHPDAREIIGDVDPLPTFEGQARAGEPDTGVPLMTRIVLGLPGQPPDGIQLFEIWTEAHETALRNGYSEVASHVAKRSLSGEHGEGSADVVAAFMRRPPPRPDPPARKRTRRQRRKNNKSNKSNKSSRRH